ncbi:rpa1, partial [Symbiodinium necroappetens]
ARQLGDKAASLQSQPEKDLGEALKEDNLVWRSELRGDSQRPQTCTAPKMCPHSLFVGEVLRGVLSTATLQDPACDGVEAVHVKVESDKVSLECEGINLFGLLCLPPTLVGHSQIYTNNIRHVLETFGVEAARASVVREVRGVFGHYGIQVDHRHLSLIADYMAQAGGLRPFNRMGMVHCTSPLLQMSYETTMQFLSGACKEDLLDNMISPASAIVLGQPPAVGTGVVNLLVDLDPPDPPWKKQRRFKFPM